MNELGTPSTSSWSSSAAAATRGIEPAQQAAGAARHGDPGERREGRDVGQRLLHQCHAPVRVGVDQCPRHPEPAGDTGATRRRSARRPPRTRDQAVAVVGGLGEAEVVEDRDPDEEVAARRGSRSSSEASTQMSIDASKRPCQTIASHRIRPPRPVGLRSSIAWTSAAQACSCTGSVPPDAETTSALSTALPLELVLAHLEQGPDQIGEVAPAEEEERRGGTAHPGCELARPHRRARATPPPASCRLPAPDEARSARPPRCTGRRRAAPAIVAIQRAMALRAAARSPRSSSCSRAKARIVSSMR